MEKAFKILDDIDTIVAVGEYVGRSNAAATGVVRSPALEIIAAKVATLYGDVLLALGDDAKIVMDYRTGVQENSRWARTVADAMRSGHLEVDKGIPILQFLADDSDRRVAAAEAIYGR